MNEQCDIWCVGSETLIIVPEFQKGTPEINLLKPNDIYIYIYVVPQR